MIDYEAMLLKLYTDADGMRQLITLGLKDENVEMLGDDALATWKTARSWYQRKAQPISMEVLLHDHEQYVKNNQEQGDEGVDPEPAWLVKTLQVRYLRKMFKERLLEAEDDGTYETEIDYEESLKRTKSLARDLLRITTNSSSDKPLEPMSKDLEKFVNDTLSWEDRIKDGTEKEPITFGFDMVDQVYKGIRTGEVVVMGAYAKIGKSFLLCKSALQAAMKGYNVALWTLENSDEETYARLTALAGRFPYSQVSNRAIHPGQRDEFRKLVGKDVFERLHVKQPQSQASSTLDEMYWESKDAGIDLFVGDQLSHVYYPSESRSDPDWLTEGKKLLKARQLSKETHMASIWAAQLNQKAAKSDDPDSTMMARSQGIVQGADFVFYLSDPTKGLGNVRKLSCSTTRRGPTMKWELIFNYSPLAIEAVRVL